MKKYLIPFVILLICFSFYYPGKAQKNSSGFADPPKEFSVMPFWFWNDTLKDAEIIRQIADFEAHGVYGFVIHPRIGLPESIGWLSPRMIHFMHVAIRRRHEGTCTSFFTMKACTLPVLPVDR